MSDVRFDGATAFITGGAQGIGFGIAQSLAKRGAKLAIVDINQDKLREAQDTLGALTQTETYLLDVRDRDAYAAIADEAEAALGPVTLLFNNAGVAGGAGADQMSYENWDWFLGINIGGVVNGLQTFVPRMIERQLGGYVVNTASGAGLVGQSTAYLYVTAKFAIVGLSESLQPDLRKYGIGVSVLCPGPVATTILSNTADQQRADLAPGNILPEKYIESGESSLSQGTSPEAVGEMVIDAMEHNRLYIHTDDIMLEPVKARTAMILSAMPSVLAGKISLSEITGVAGGGNATSDGSIDGSFAIEMLTPTAPVTMTVTFATEVGLLTATVQNGGESNTAHDLSLEGSCVRFKVPVTVPMPLVLDFVATVEGDVITGTASVGATLSLDFSGKRI